MIDPLGRVRFQPGVCDCLLDRGGEAFQASSSLSEEASNLVIGEEPPFTVWRRRPNGRNEKEYSSSFCRARLTGCHRSTTTGSATIKSPTV
jgi:hypothetical protein